MNSSIHSSKNASPASLLFGMYNIQDTLIAQAQTALRTMDAAHIATSPQDITVFPVDSYVLARYTTQPPTRLHTLGTVSSGIDPQL